MIKLKHDLVRVDDNLIDPDASIDLFFEGDKYYDFGYAEYDQRFIKDFRAFYSKKKNM